MPFEKCLGEWTLKDLMSIGNSIFMRAKHERTNENVVYSEDGMDWVGWTGMRVRKSALIKDERDENDDDDDEEEEDDDGKKVIEKCSTVALNWIE